jgi:hypothetical protein
MGKDAEILRGRREALRAKSETEEEEDGERQGAEGIRQARGSSFRRLDAVFLARDD